MKRWAALASLALICVAGPAGAQDQAARDWLEARLAENDAGRYGGAAFTPAFGGGGDAAGTAVVTWDRLRRDGYRAPFAEYAAFLVANRGWPQEAVIRARAEAAAGPATPFGDRIAHFGRFPPLTGNGAYRLAEAFAAAGRASEAARWAAAAWREGDLPPALEGELLARFGAVLTPADHAARVDELLWAKNTSAAARALPFVSGEARAVAAARLALQTNAADASARVAALPPSALADPGLLLDRARVLAANRDAAGARRLIADTTIAPGTVRWPVAWMRLRLGLAREAARDGQFDTAYRIAAGHNAFPMGRALNDRPLAERDVFTDLEWLAGWTAYHDLKRPDAALRHFARYQAGAKTPTTRTRGLYWAGRAAEAAGDPTGARRFWAEAALEADAFYGQLAAERFGRPVALALANPAPPAAAERAAFEADARVRAATTLGAIGLRDRQTLFLRALASGATTARERRLVADLGSRLGRRDLAVIVSRLARAEGEPPSLDAFPRLPEAAVTGEATMANAITRQESQFDRTAISRAGARGLMQLMPGTAAEQAGKMGVNYEIRRLTTDEGYNAMLGSGYYRRLLAQWGGDHVLAVASYNAGAGNVRRWITANGDPRAGVDRLVWIERIPFAETRSYVHRVLENAVVYDRLRGGNAPLSRFLGTAPAGAGVASAGP